MNGLCVFDSSKVHISFTLSSPEEFSAQCLSTICNEQASAVLNTFKLVPGVRFDWASRPPRWLFPISFHDQLYALLEKMHDACIHPLPSSILDVMREKHRLRNNNVNGLYDALKLDSFIPESLLVQLASFQKQGVEFILRNDGRALLADDMGLGKTRTSIAAAVAYTGDWPVLIVCPSSARHNWHAELTTLLVPVCIQKTDILTVESASQSLTKRVGSYKFVIVSYNLMQRLSARLQEMRFGIIICDECHYLKNSRANRTKALVPMIKAAKRAVLISGTPALSRPLELFTQLNSLDPKAWPDEKEFGRRYCRPISTLSIGDNGSAEDGLGSGSSAILQDNAHIAHGASTSHAQELHVMLTSTLMIRRLKKDILHYLPEKLREVVKVPVHNAPMRERLRQLLSQFLEVDTQDSNASNIRGDASSARGNKSKRGVANNTSTTSSSELVHLGPHGTATDAAQKNERMGLLLQMFTLSGEAKLPGFLEHVKAFLDDPHAGKLLIFAHHRAVMDAIARYVVDRGENLIRIDGQTSGRDRHDNTIYFQTTPSCRVALLAITAAGISITLTAAATVYFAEMFWTPGSLIQAEDRAHRIGQTRRVHVKYFLGEGTVDEILWPLVKNKVRTLGEVVEGDMAALFDHTAGENSSFVTKKGTKKLKGKDVSEADVDAESMQSLNRDIYALARDLGAQALRSALAPTADDDDDRDEAEQSHSHALFDDAEDGNDAEAQGPIRRNADSQDRKRDPDAIAALYMQREHQQLNESVQATLENPAHNRKKRTVIALDESDGDSQGECSNATDIAEQYVRDLIGRGKLPNHSAKFL